MEAREEGRHRKCNARGRAGDGLYDHVQHRLPNMRQSRLAHPDALLTEQQAYRQAGRAGHARREQATRTCLAICALAALHRHEPPAAEPLQARLQLVIGITELAGGLHGGLKSRMVRLLAYLLQAGWNRSSERLN